MYIKNDDWLNRLQVDKNIENMDRTIKRIYVIFNYT